MTKIIDNTKGLTRQEIASIKYALMLLKPEQKENSFQFGNYDVDYWLHTIPNVHDDQIIVVRVSCI